MGGKVNTMKPFRIGKIAYTNILPIYYYFNLENKDLPIELIHRVPTELNRGMANGTMDISPISSFAYAEQFPNVLLIPDLSISSWGAVRSIYLFSRKPSLSQLDGATIALTTSSSTSVNLLRIILEIFEGVQPNYHFFAPDFEQMMEKADAALLIGDDAIKTSWKYKDYYAFDLGYEWYIRTGLSMTFAVWAIRKEVVKEREKEILGVLKLFLTAKTLGKKRLGPVIQEAQSRLGGSRSFWQEYYEGLCYDLGEKEIKGLETFYHYAFQLGLLDREVEVQLLEVPKACIGSDRVK